MMHLLLTADWDTGEIMDSIRDLARSWNWSRGRVERFLEELAPLINGPETGHQTGHQTGRYSVKNWDTYVETRATKRATPRAKNGPPQRKPVELTYPPLWGEKAQAGMARWIEYRTKCRKPLQLMTLQRCIDSYAEKPREFVAAVDHSILNGYQGLFDDPIYKKRPSKLDIELEILKES